MRKISTSLNIKGFTLIELIISMFILGVVLSFVVSVITFSTNFLKNEESQISNQSNVRIVYVQFEKDVRKFGIPSTTVFGASDSCYVLGTSPSTVTYCYNSTSKEVSRGGTVIAKDILSFDVVKAANAYSVDLDIVSEMDDWNQNNVIDIRLYLRK